MLYCKKNFKKLKIKNHFQLSIEIKVVLINYFLGNVK